MTDSASNAAAFSVSELAFSLKRTLEDAYGHVRLRGEVSKVTRHSSGHVYLTLKDDKAAIDGVIWKGVVRGLACQPEQGLEVIATGKITTFPASSKYQIVIDSLEPAGIGALLAQLERLKAKLQAEGLFDPGKKRPIPPMPTVIGVITSPTGAVIRDILHRIRERWPCHVLVWPVVVQGDQAAQQVAAAIAGFNGLGLDSKVPRPDVLIVARGGGSVEDLWAFNDEALARAVAASDIPVISAVGHETDTTLIDFVSDRRAPTPTAAAEMASPVLAELKAAVMDLDRRLMRAGGRLLEDRRVRLSATSRGLPRPADLLSVASQRFDLSAGRLNAALERNVSLHDRDLMRFAARLTPSLLDRPRRLKAERLNDLATRLGLATRRSADQAERRARLPDLAARMAGAVDRKLSAATERLSGLDKLRLSLDPNRPLELGFARVHHADGTLARSGAELAEGEAVRLVFAHDSRQALISDAAAPPPTAKPPKVPPKKTAEGSQGSLF